MTSLSPHWWEGKPTVSYDDVPTLERAAKALCPPLGRWLACRRIKRVMELRLALKAQGRSKRSQAAFKGHATRKGRGKP